MDELKRVEIIRTAQADGTFGMMIVAGNPFCVTLERWWIDNKPFISCIPEGEYICQRVNSPRYGVCYEVMDVPGRTDILFHAGNLVLNSRGCILLGMGFGKISGRPGIVNSKKAVGMFMREMTGEARFRLEVSSVDTARRDPA